MKSTTGPASDSHPEMRQDLKKPMKAPANALSGNTTEAEENRALDYMLRGGKVKEGQQPNLEPR